MSTSESVSSGHPDKIADQIADAILDAHLEQDRDARVAVEVMVKNDVIVLAGEVTSKADVDYHHVANQVFKNAGYLIPYKVDSHITTQSADIAMGMADGGAGDQCIVYGYATDEHQSLIPASLHTAHRLMRRHEEVRFRHPFLLPDGKCMVTQQPYTDIPDRVVISVQHLGFTGVEEVRDWVHENIVVPVVGTKVPEVLINPGGRFVEGGPDADAGLTGRKLAVDTYGGLASHGGGAFSGKDPSKMDRTGAYAARQLANSIILHGLANQCQVELNYAIGIAEPTAIRVRTFDTGAIQENRIETMIREQIDLTPEGIIDRLDLKRPIYEQTARFGHFGNPMYPWERPVSFK